MARPPYPPQQQQQRRPVPPPAKPEVWLDLNTDFGQTADRPFFEGKERTLLHYVSSVSIPCCVHDGDPAQVLKDMQTARKNNCLIGAHIAYPDPKTLGYTPIELSEEELRAWVILQLGAFYGLAKSQGIDVAHVRPHAALYAAFINNKEVALTVAKAIHEFDPWLMLVLPISPISDEIQATVPLQYAPEVYLGKKVGADGAILLDKFKETLHPQAVIEQVKQLVTASTLTTADGETVKIKYKTLHISPKLQGNMMVAERINAMVGEPTAMTLVAAGNSGWAQ